MVLVAIPYSHTNIFFLSLLYLPMIKNILFLCFYSQRLISTNPTHKSFSYPLGWEIGVWNLTGYAQPRCDHSNSKPSSSLHIRHTSAQLHGWGTDLTSCGSSNRELPLSVLVERWGIWGTAVLSCTTWSLFTKHSELTGEKHLLLYLTESSSPYSQNKNFKLHRNSFISAFKLSVQFVKGVRKEGALVEYIQCCNLYKGICF